MRPRLTASSSDSSIRSRVSITRLSGVMTPPLSALRSSATLLPEKSGVLALRARAWPPFLAAALRLLAVVRWAVEALAVDVFAREVDAFARELEDFARELDDFARELDDFEAALALRVDPPLRPAGALRARGMCGFPLPRLVGDGTISRERPP